MPRKHDPSKSDRSGRPRIWVGGRCRSPFQADEPAGSVHKDLVLWLEPESTSMVGMTECESSRSAGALVTLLQDAMAQPLSGLARRPDVVQVSDQHLADLLRRFYGNQFQIVVAPTPELEGIAAAAAAAMEVDDEDDSYLEYGLLEPEAVAEMFAAADTLYRLAPWKGIYDSQVVQLDIPEFDVEGACLSIIGNLGESFGFLVFPSYDAFMSFIEAAEHCDLEAEVDFGTGWIALDFNRGAELPDTMRREVASHGWPVASADAYPCAHRYGRGGEPQPVDQRTLEILTVAAGVFAAFFREHGAMFAQEEVDQLTVTYADDSGREASVTAPHPEDLAPFDELDQQAPIIEVPAPPKVGRNDPCPCGSGRKYKQCHLREDEEAYQTAVRYAEIRSVEDRLFENLVRFAVRRFGTKWMRHAHAFQDHEEAMQLAEVWGLFHHRAEGKPVVEWFLEDRGSRLTTAERAWLTAQRDAWLSVWEVTEVSPGRSMTMHDLVSGTSRLVHETTASRTVVKHDALLCRIIEVDGIAMFGGIHPRLLPPRAAAAVVDRVKSRLRKRRDIPVERLREHAAGRYMIRSWEEEVARLDERSAVPPTVTNTDGDPLLFTVDHFSVPGDSRAQVAQNLASCEGVDPTDRGDDEDLFVFSRPGDPVRGDLANTIIGQADLADTTLRLETNSLRRADMLRARIENACGGLIRHEKRETVDPLELLAARERDSRPSSSPASPSDGDAAALIHKQRHYATWIDHPLPALGGQTAREAVKSAEGRRAVDLLLKEMENQEQRRSPGAPFDFSVIRKSLRLD